MKGFLAGLWLAPAAGGIPVAWCHLMEDCPADAAILPNPAEGSAARVNLGEAALAAIREAAQSRLAAISGARDDVGRDNFRDVPDRERRDAYRRFLARAPDAAPALAGFPASDGNPAKDVEALLSRLRAQGTDQILEVVLDTRPLPHLHAVRIVVPRLLPLLDG